MKTEDPSSSRSQLVLNPLSLAQKEGQDLYSFNVEGVDGDFDVKVLAEYTSFVSIKNIMGNTVTVERLKPLTEANPYAIVRVTSGTLGLRYWYLAVDEEAVIGGQSTYSGLSIEPVSVAQKPGTELYTFAVKSDGGKFEVAVIAAYSDFITVEGITGNEVTIRLIKPLTESNLYAVVKVTSGTHGIRYWYLAFDEDAVIKP